MNRRQPTVRPMVFSAAVLAGLLGAAAPARADAAADAAQVKRLIKQTKNSRTRESAVAELARMGAPAVEGIVAALLDKSTGVYAAQAQSLLVAMGPGVVKDVAGMLRHRDASIRRVALKALAEFGPLAAGQVEALVKILDAPDPTAQMGLRRYAAAALGEIGPAAAPAVHALAQSLEDRDDVHGFLRGAAVAALGQIGPAASQAAADLAKVLANDAYSSDRREAAARALGLIATPAEVIVPALQKALQENPDTLIAREAAVALGKVGPEAKPAVVDIVASLDSKTVGYRGLQALAGIGPGAADAVDELIKRLAGANVFDRKYAAEALGLIGPEAKRAIPDLVKAFRPLKADDPFRVAIVVAIARLEGYPSRAVPQLIKWLNSPSSAVSAAALEALGQLGKHAREALGTLVLLIEKSDVRPGGKPWRAIEALGNMGEISKAAVPYLIKIVEARARPVRRDEAPIRTAAIEALAKIAPKDAAVLAALKAAAAEDPDLKVRRLAMKTAALLAARSSTGGE